MDYRKLVLICLCFGITSCTSAPRLAGLEDWSSSNHSSETRKFREGVHSPFILTQSGDKIVNPEHILRASDLLELSCVRRTGYAASRITVDAYAYDHKDAQILQTLAQETKAAILPLDVIADFHKLEISCSSETTTISFCDSPVDANCANQIGVSSWQKLQEKLLGSHVAALLRPRPDPVLQPFDQIRVSRTRVVDEDGLATFGLVDNWLLEVSEDGLLPLPMPGISPADGGTDFDYIRERAWLSSAALSMYALEVSTGSNCSTSGVRLSTVQACLNWATGSADSGLGLSKNKRTRSMEARFAACKKLGIDKRYRPADEEVLNSWSLDLENNTATLIVEDGRRVPMLVGNGATLVSTVQQAYKQATGQELLGGWIGSHRTAYLTVQSNAGMCRVNAAPFFIQIDKTSSEEHAMIGLFRGDTVQVSRGRPRKVKTD